MLSEYGWIFGVGSWRVSIGFLRQWTWEHRRIPGIRYHYAFGWFDVVFWRNADWMLARIRQERASNGH
jgi:hypothetical protein